jgi:hypothetical protein
VLRHESFTLVSSLPAPIHSISQTLSLNPSRSEKRKDFFIANKYERERPSDHDSGNNDNNQIDETAFRRRLNIGFR